MIPRIKPSHHHQELRSTLLASEAQLKSACNRFELSFASYIGTHYAIALNRGRYGLLLILKALGLPHGSNVAIPAVCCPAVEDAVIAAGFTPIFAEVGFDGNISPSGAKQAIMKGAKAVVVAHINGMPAPMSSIIDECEQNNIPLIEDCAQALGSEYASRRVGSYGIASIFSFAFDKHICLGLGGAVVTNNTGLAIRIRELVSDTTTHNREIEILYGLVRLEALFDSNNYSSFIPVDDGLHRTLAQEDKENIDRWLKGGTLAQFNPSLKKSSGLTTRVTRLLRIKNKPNNEFEKPMLMGPLRALLALKLLKKITEENTYRRHLAELWRDGLSGLRHFSRSAWDPAWFRPAPLRYSLLVDPLKRSKLINLFSELGVECGAFNWPEPLSPLPNAQDFCRRIVNLPNFPSLEPEMVINISNRIHEVWS